jgi:hypothetical protein
VTTDLEVLWILLSARLREAPRGARLASPLRSEPPPPEPSRVAGEAESGVFRVARASGPSLQAQ